jgi:hypothetical protein
MYFAVDMHFAIGAAGDGDVAGGIGKFQPNGTCGGQGTIKATHGGGANGAAGHGYSGEEQSQGNHKSAMRHSASGHVRRLALGAPQTVSGLKA